MQEVSGGVEPGRNDMMTTTKSSSSLSRRLPHRHRHHFALFIIYLKLLTYPTAARTEEPRETQSFCDEEGVLLTNGRMDGQTTEASTYMPKTTTLPVSTTTPLSTVACALQSLPPLLVG